MYKCENIGLDIDFYIRLNQAPISVVIDLLKPMDEYTEISDLRQQIFKIVQKASYVMIKRPLTKESINEKRFYNKITKDMLNSKVPFLFQMLYMNFVIENEQYLVFNTPNISLNYLKDSANHSLFTAKWWSTFLYQIARAIKYLEEEEITHNFLGIDAINFYVYPTTPDDIGIMISSFQRSPLFIKGRDLMYFKNSLLGSTISNTIPDGLVRLLKTSKTGEELLREIPRTRIKLIII